MDHNSSIGCNVTECKHHCKDDDYCTLDKINVVKNNKVQHFSWNFSRKHRLRKLRIRIGLKFLGPLVFL